MIEDLRARIHDDMDRTIDELSRLVRIPSVGYPGYDPVNVRSSAELTRELLASAGVAETRLLEPGGHPAVYGRIEGPAGAPTLLLYAHHDVQPPGAPEEWTSPPFEPEIRDGRLYGRGAEDNKAGIALHAAALRALGSEPGVTIKILIEGEEECSTEHLADLVVGHADLLRADIAVIADGGNERTGLPTIETSVRGVVDCVVEVSVMPIAQHSGSYGGAVPDAITALARIIATLHDDEGNVAIEGLRRFPWQGEPVLEDELREDAGLFDGVRLIGSGPLADRLLSGPAVSVLGIDAPTIRNSSNQIVPAARARISVRLAPGEDADRAGGLLREHVTRNAPWGVRVSVHMGTDSAGYMADTTSRAHRQMKSAMADAFGVTDVHEIGSGGSVPFVPMLADTFPEIEILIVGAGDDRSNSHSIDESVDLLDLERMILAEALLIRRLAS